MPRLLLTVMILLLVSACSTKPAIKVDVNATNSDSDSRLLFSQPF